MTITRDVVVREIAVTKKRLLALQNMLATFPAPVAPVTAKPKPGPAAGANLAKKPPTAAPQQQSVTQ